MNEAEIVKIKECIDMFLRAFGVAGEVIVKKTDDTLVANISTGRPELLIGRGGQTLLALQQVVRAMLGKDIDSEEVLIIDVEGYRQKHNDRVKMIAREAALKVMASGKPESLQPMSSYERRLVHMALSDFTELIGESEGYGLERHIVVKPKSL